MYSLFWKEVSDSLLIGNKERVPYVRHDLFKSEWEAIGTIFVKGFIDIGYIPTILSRSFITYCAFGIVNSEDLIESFKNYVSVDEKQLLDDALKKENDETYTSDEMFEFLDTFKCRTAVSKCNIENLISELARQELIQKPYIMASCWSTVFTELRRRDGFDCAENIKNLYNQIEPNNKRVLKLFKADPVDDAEREAFGHLKRFVKGLDLDPLKKFLQFATGAEVIIVEKIEVSFVKYDSNFCRRPIAHTCGPVLEIPKTYSNFCELREDFTNILNKTTWEMDIV